MGLLYIGHSFACAMFTVAHEHLVFRSYFFWGGGFGVHRTWRGGGVHFVPPLVFVITSVPHVGPLPLMPPPLLPVNRDLDPPIPVLWPLWILCPRPCSFWFPRWPM